MSTQPVTFDTAFDTAFAMTPADHLRSAAIQPADVMETAEVASMLGVNHQTVGRWARTGVIPVLCTLGRGHLFRTADVLAYAEQPPARLGRPRGSRTRTHLEAV